MKKSAFSRSLELAKMAAKIGLREARSGDLASRLEQARILAQSLSQLKGAAMKAGQLLSIEMGDYFPKEALEVLSVLQNAAKPEDSKQIRKIVERELGPENFLKLQNFSEKSSAAASIGQVHRARFEGREIALKVQYEGVAESIESDLKVLRGVAQAFCAFTGRKMDLGPLFSEFRHVLSQEVDYTKEAELQTRYRKFLQEIHRGSGYAYAVPEVFLELSTKQLLVMEWVDAVTLKDWLAAKPTREARECVAHALLNLYCYEFFEWGLVQTDPNFANFLIRQEHSDIQLVLIDFGATREYEKAFVDDYIQLLRAASSGDKEKLLPEAIRFGLIDARESAEARECFTKLMNVAIQPFFSGRSSFQFADENYARLSRQVVRDLAAALKFSPPPYRLIFLHRKLGGIFSILKALEVNLDVKPYWHRMVGE